MGKFGIVDSDTIKNGKCTDVYFIRTEEALDAEDLNPLVTMEISAAALPQPWGVLCGLNDLVSLFEGIPVDVVAMPEGSIFYAGEPVLRITGRYRDFARYETALLGFLCHASGIASAASMMKLHAGDVPVHSFGSRRQHPTLAYMIERSAWIGGVDGVSNTCAPDGLPLTGTMPHAFVMCFEKTSDAWIAFDRHAPPEVPRVMLCDTFCDEKREALAAAKLGATAVRLDTPRSRRGDMRLILEEVRWELDINGYSDVKIFLTGGVDLDDIIKYRDIVDSFGVGGAIANAPVIDFSMDIVEIEGKISAKRGKRSGVKEVYEFPDGSHTVLPARHDAPKGCRALLKPVISNGHLLIDTSETCINDARKRLSENMRKLPQIQ